jgi:(5-formylfuran-3-yl)methyl phosphate synthase
MTGLLVSVRDADEARDAVEAGAELIDIKEPHAGPLGAAAPETIAEIFRVAAGRRPLSVALGELVDQKSTFGDRLPPGIRFAKLGLSGTVRQGFQPDRPANGFKNPIWHSQWRQAIEQFPSGTSPVAVIYADFESAAAPPPDEVIAHGRELGCRALLIDTFDKRGPGLLGHLSLGEIKRLVTSARTANLLVVLGGQITVAHLPDLLPLAPDYIAVRGAVCRGDRAGRLDLDLVRHFARRIRQFNRRAAAERANRGSH